MSTKSIKPHKSTKNELKLLKYLGISERDEAWVKIGDPSGHVISTYRIGQEQTEDVLIPFSPLPYEKDPTLEIVDLGGEIFGYPSSDESRAFRRIQARNLRIILYDIEAYSKALEVERLAKQEADKLKRELNEMELSGPDIFYTQRIG